MEVGRAPWTPLATPKGGVELLFKNGTIDSSVYQPCYCSGLDLYCMAPSILEILAKSSCKIKAKTRKSLTI